MPTDPPDIGLSYNLIADRLGIKTSTLQDYIKRVYKKLDAHSNTEVMIKVTKKLASEPPITSDIFSSSTD